VGMMLYGKINDPHYELITDAKWFERLSAGTLIFGITAIGIAPLWLSTMITDGLGPVLQKLLLAIN